MPELPEVETIARQLDPLLAGLRVRSVEVLDVKLAGKGIEDAAGYTVRRVRRVGKRVVLDLARGSAGPSCWISVHLRMTGRLIWCPGAAGKISRTEAAVLPDRLVHKRAVTEKSLRLVFHLAGGELRFHDTRRFGVVELHSDEPRIPETALDPMSRAFTAKALGELLAGVRGEIKPWMLRQDRIAGMGNIYASEALFAARIHPRRSSGSLTPAEARALRDAVADVMRRAVAKAGTTFSDYSDAGGKPGGFGGFLKVYGREGLDCGCGGRIERIVQQQRSTFFCPKCQA